MPNSAQLSKVKLIRSVCECVQEGVRTASIPFAQGCAHGGSLGHAKIYSTNAYKRACVQVGMRTAAYLLPQAVSMEGRRPTLKFP